MTLQMALIPGAPTLGHFDDTSQSAGARHQRAIRTGAGCPVILLRRQASYPGARTVLRPVGGLPVSDDQRDMQSPRRQSQQELIVPCSVLMLYAKKDMRLRAEASGGQAPLQIKLAVRAARVVVLGGVVMALAMSLATWYPSHLRFIRAFALTGGALVPYLPSACPRPHRFSGVGLKNGHLELLLGGHYALCVIAAVLAAISEITDMFMKFYWELRWQAH
ncbi:hypothetical protein CORC01_10814 [Colletotrichum orchidophilum]|uniref:Uncharacterized protein n=1 Tax=Colletotrichum orchidophilum TaxID=1209926 RepID=A0A1G4AXS2_9PEZI|nr:uncharacterized protein CORC01_10814 [Colletotrichum orchidophilum]OHE93915.1 hypothetical protein CORC01_10814 [Colletotrichum orchidophilum]